MTARTSARDTGRSTVGNKSMVSMGTGVGGSSEMLEREIAIFCALIPTDFTGDSFYFGLTHYTLQLEWRFFIKLELDARILGLFGHEMTVRLKKPKQGMEKTMHIDPHEIPVLPLSVSKTSVRGMAKTKPAADSPPASIKTSASFKTMKSMKSSGAIEDSRDTMKTAEKKILKSPDTAGVLKTHTNLHMDFSTVSSMNTAASSVPPGIAEQKPESKKSSKESTISSLEGAAPAGAGDAEYST